MESISAMCRSLSAVRQCMCCIPGRSEIARVRVFEAMCLGGLICRKRKACGANSRARAARPAGRRGGRPRIALTLPSHTASSRRCNPTTTPNQTISRWRPPRDLQDK